MAGTEFGNLALFLSTTQPFKLGTSILFLLFMEIKGQGVGGVGQKPNQVEKKMTTELGPLLPFSGVGNSKNK